MCNSMSMNIKSTSITSAIGVVCSCTKRRQLNSLSAQYYQEFLLGVIRSIVVVYAAVH